MSGIVPGPTGSLDAWGRFHRAFAKIIHGHPDILDLLDRSAEEIDHRVHHSPWTCGACGFLAAILAAWINDPQRLKWWMVARRRRQYGGTGYPHSLVSYDSDIPEVGRVYLDGVMWSRDPKAILAVWHAHRIVRVDRRHIEHMEDNFGHVPTDARGIEQAVQALNSIFGRWPR